jgi:uncharacterized membrane protein YccC
MTAILSTAEANESRTLAADIVARLQSPSFAGLIFSLKTVSAALIALYISFWLGLDEPKWALLTVFIVSQPDSGLVLAKSFYRILGSIAGVLASTVLVFAFAQYGVLFLASLAVCIGLCNFAARAARNFTSYGFLLAGYTVAIVGLPAALNPGGAYPLLVARFTEISLGIACAALVSRLVFPSALAPKLERLARDLTFRAERFAAAIADPAADRTRITTDLTQVARDVGAAETMRASAFFESADARLTNAPVRAVTEAALDLLRCGGGGGGAPPPAGPVRGHKSSNPAGVGRRNRRYAPRQWRGSRRARLFRRRTSRFNRSCSAARCLRRS